MLFNSLDFAVFLPLVFLLYWFVVRQNLRVQNAFLTGVSYIFYGWWDWRFLSLLLFSSLVDYTVGLALSREARAGRRKFYLLLTLLCNLGLLGFFKYYHFFIENFAEAFRFFGWKFSTSSLGIVLPVGISFYTFQSLSYGIDVYRRKITPTRDPIAFLAFVSFFPQLVAGPIERASHLLPQILQKRTFSYPQAVDGLRQMLWGFFKKMVIADNCAVYADTIFNQPGLYSGSTLLTGCFFFAIQIYCDFSGYSDIAIGTSRLFGVDLKANFSFPYFSRDIAEFWRRWHISLSTWFRDYVYIPLGGSRKGKARTILNTFITFLVSGFWHGAHWKFGAWGLYHAILFLPLLLLRKNRVHLDAVAAGKIFASWKETLSIGFTFLLVMLGWVLFRAENLATAGDIYQQIFSPSLLKVPQVLPGSILLVTVLFMGIEWAGRENRYAIERTGESWPRWARLSFYYLLTGMIFFMGGQQQNFIYFQF